MPPQRRCKICHASYSNERFCPIDGGAVIEDGPTVDPMVGRTIDGRYLVRAPLGRGGMGVVYEADHVGLDKRVAIKFLNHEGAEPDAVARFRREARAASKLAHEHVVQIFDVGTTSDGADFIVMEHVEGTDLRQALDSGPFEPMRAVAIARQILRGLHAIHQAGIIHRDVKPANVLLTRRGDVRDFVKLTDFGIAKTIRDVSEPLTGTGKVVGTPQFMAPEQFVEQNFDHRADLYSVGLTLFAMLAGDVPFTARTVARLAAMHLSDAPPSLDELRPGLPAPLIRAIARALEKSPRDRFPDALAFIAALDAIAPETLAHADTATGVIRPSVRDLAEPATAVERAAAQTPDGTPTRKSKPALHEDATDAPATRESKRIGDENAADEPTTRKSKPVIDEEATDEGATRKSKPVIDEEATNKAATRKSKSVIDEDATNKAATRKSKSVIDEDAADEPTTRESKSVIDEEATNKAATRKSKSVIDEDAADEPTTRESKRVIDEDATDKAATRESKRASDDAGTGAAGTRKSRRSSSDSGLDDGTRKSPDRGAEPTADQNRPASARALRPWLFAALAVLALGGIAILARERLRETNRVDAIGGDAATSAQLAAEQLAAARAAERRGDLELAIASYQAAYAADPDAEPLYRIAELEERVGRPAEAVRYFRRYLEAAPAAADRESVLARIAKLEPPMIDAGIAALDAAAAIPKPGQSTKRDLCVCYGGKPELGFGALCRKTTTALCRCSFVEGTGRVRICPSPFRDVGRERVCDVDPDYDKFHVRAKPGEPCTGYVGPTTPVTAAYECSYCRDEDPFSYFGKNDDPCTGFISATAERVTGRLFNCGLRRGD